jgi:lambda repressor-like predicted transcriptional regulator
MANRNPTPKPEDVRAGARLRALLEAAGIGQRAVARYIPGLHQPSVSQIVTGVVTAWPKARRDLSNLLGVPEEVIWPPRADDRR